MLEIISTVCTLIVSVQVIRVLYNFLYNQVIGPAISAGPDLKKMGKWAGKQFSYFFHSYILFFRL